MCPCMFLPIRFSWIEDRLRSAAFDRSRSVSSVAAVVPNQNRLYFIDTALTKAYKRVNLGKQGKDGGLGLAYNPQTDVLYVANAGDNTVTRISNPCQ